MGEHYTCQQRISAALRYNTDTNDISRPSPGLCKTDMRQWKTNKRPFQLVCKLFKYIEHGSIFGAK